MAGDEFLQAQNDGYVSGFMLGKWIALEATSLTDFVFGRYGPLPPPDVWAFLSGLAQGVVDQRDKVDHVPFDVQWREAVDIDPFLPSPK